MGKRKQTVTQLKKKLEKIIADYVKVRDDFICQKCNKFLGGSNCHASHIIPRSAGNQYRFDPINLKTLCFHCHINWWHKNPIEAAEWFKENFPDRYKYLFDSPKEIKKFTPSDLEEMIEEYKEKLTLLKKEKGLD